MTTRDQQRSGRKANPQRGSWSEGGLAYTIEKRARGNIGEDSPKKKKIFSEQSKARRPPKSGGTNSHHVESRSPGRSTPKQLKARDAENLVEKREGRREKKQGSIETTGRVRNRPSRRKSKARGGRGGLKTRTRPAPLKVHELKPGLRVGTPGV